MHVIVGDIHGCFDELMALLDKIGPSADDTIISLGDMVDRGPKSPEVISFFAKNKNAQSLLGNHESKHVGFSLGLLPEKYFGKNQRKTVKQFEDRKGRVDTMTYAEALAYFKTLPLFIELPEAIIVHAGLMYGIPLASQNRKILSGIGFQIENKLDKGTGLFHWCEAYPPNEKPVIFGHLGIGKAPWPLPQRNNLWPIDTGCASGGYLTAITLPDFAVFQIKSFKA